MTGSKKRAALLEKSKRRLQWDKNVLLGAGGIVATIVLAVVAAPKTVSSAWLFVAWPLAAWCMIHVSRWLVPSARKARLMLAITLNVAVAGGTVWGYLRLVPGPEPEQSTPTARIVVKNSNASFRDNYNLPSVEADKSQVDISRNFWGDDPKPWLEDVKRARSNRQLVDELMEQKWKQLEAKWSSLSPQERTTQERRFLQLRQEIYADLNDSDRLAALVQRLGK